MQSFEAMMAKKKLLSSSYNSMIMKYFQKIFVAVILFLWGCFASAQVIKGVVCDETTKKPIANVHVYLDGTSINTVTNASGRFELRPKSEINTQLILQHLLYKTASINNPFRGLPDTLYIEERIYDLTEVTVSADRFTRKQKMKAFREQFLGMSRAARSCTILNEDDIELYFNMQTHTLLASSDNPIVVVNDYLGYKVSFTLIDFRTQYDLSVVSLNNEDVYKSFFAVISSFTDIAPDNGRIKRRRENVYELSSNYFFRCFSNDSLKENRFTLFNKQFPIDHRQYFTTKDTLMQKKISIIPETDINKEMTSSSGPKATVTVKGLDSGPKLTGVISVLNRNRIQSDIYFMTDSFLVDRYGNIDQIDKILFSESGQMGKLRAGDMLPIDYEP